MRRGPSGCPKAKFSGRSRVQVRAASPTVSIALTVRFHFGGQKCVEEAAAIRAGRGEVSVEQIPSFSIYYLSITGRKKAPSTFNLGLQVLCLPFWRLREQSQGNSMVESLERSADGHGVREKNLFLRSPTWPWAPLTLIEETEQNKTKATALTSKGIRVYS